MKREIHLIVRFTHTVCLMYICCVAFDSRAYHLCCIIVCDIVWNSGSLPRGPRHFLTKKHKAINLVAQARSFYHSKDPKIDYDKIGTKVQCLYVSRPEELNKETLPLPRSNRDFDLVISTGRCSLVKCNAGLCLKTKWIVEPKENGEQQIEVSITKNCITKLSIKNALLLLLNL